METSRPAALVRAPRADAPEAQLAAEVLTRLNRVTHLITVNVRHINDTLERILLDQPDVEELERMLKAFRERLASA